jgi:hypothetical protein
MKFNMFHKQFNGAEPVAEGYIITNLNKYIIDLISN